MARKYDIRNSNTDQASANSVHRQIGSITPTSKDPKDVGSRKGAGSVPRARRRKGAAGSVDSAARARRTHAVHCWPTA